MLTSSGIVVLDSSYRAKTDESIRARQERRLLYHQSFPIIDVFGTRFVVGEESLDGATDIIVAHFSPNGQKIEYNPSGLEVEFTIPLVIDHRKPEARSIYSSHHYKAVHIYFPFDGEEYYHIGEVQLLTLEWTRIANRTRGRYERRQFRA